ncbi:hypothetical protein [Streptomyces nigrescens]|uniref:Ricin B lectin domain-containing protein n=1 Tax=Streptomyces nigrescens TaxID=1920 RepID=A0ABY7J0L4_STRNI|nr:hypothetical protein [Streptomyces nigrescens]WAU03727.1 hypothetical protein STRNI_001893 [Streptomyces nigrescens]
MNFTFTSPSDQGRITIYKVGSTPGKDQVIADATLGRFDGSIQPVATWTGGRYYATLSVATSPPSGFTELARTSFTVGNFDQRAPTIMQAGLPADNPLEKAQAALDRESVPGNEVALDDAFRMGSGYFRIRSKATNNCLALPADNTPSGPTTWTPCNESSQVFYLTPGLHPGGYFVRPLRGPNGCLKAVRSQEPEVGSWAPQFGSCSDGQDEHDALTTSGKANEASADLTWNFFPVQGGRAVENAQVDSIPLSDMAQSGNSVHMCNWGAFVAYFVFDYTTTDKTGVDTDGHYQSGTVTAGQCIEVNPPNGYLAGTVTPVLQMEGAGKWAAMGATTIAGWNADLTVHTNGNLCNSYAWTTARSSNAAVAMDAYPGTDCWNDTTNGVKNTFTWKDAYHYVVSMLPIVFPGDKSIGSSPESLFSGLGKNFGAKVPTATNNLYKNIYSIGWHAT